MAYKKRIPPVKVKLSVEKFNYLIELLDSYDNKTDEKISKDAEKLKEKLLRYSIPRFIEDQEVFIDTRFYPNESAQIIDLLINNEKEINVTANHFAELLRIRENSKENE